MNKISINKNLNFIILVICDSIQDVHSSYKKKWNILASHKSLFLYRNFIQIKIGLNIVHS